MFEVLIWSSGAYFWFPTSRLGSGQFLDVAGSTFGTGAGGAASRAGCRVAGCCGAAPCPASWDNLATVDPMTDRASAAAAMLRMTWVVIVRRVEIADRGFRGSRRRRRL